MPERACPARPIHQLPEGAHHINCPALTGWLLISPAPSLPDATRYSLPNCLIRLLEFVDLPTRLAWIPDAADIHA